jgi:hypothetical protein
MADTSIVADITVSPAPDYTVINDFSLYFVNYTPYRNSMNCFGGTTRHGCTRLVWLKTVEESANCARSCHLNSMELSACWNTVSCLAGQKLFPFYGTEVSLLCSQESYTGSCLEATESSPHAHTVFFSQYYTFKTSLRCATCPTHLILHEFISIIIFDKQYTL